MEFKMIFASVLWSATVIAPLSSEFREDSVAFNFITVSNNTTSYNSIDNNNNAAAIAFFMFIRISYGQTAIVGTKNAVYVVIQYL